VKPRACLVAGHGADAHRHAGSWLWFYKPAASEPAWWLALVREAESASAPSPMQWAIRRYRRELGHA